MGSSGRDIEDLISERNTLNTQISAFVEKRKKADEQIHILASKVSALDRQISQMKKKGSKRKTGITDHALLRYLERIHGFDSEKVRKALLTDSLDKCIKTYGTGKVTEDGITYIFKDNVVVTIMVN